MNAIHSGMRRSIPAILAGTFLFLVASPVWAQGEFRMKYEELEELDRSPAFRAYRFMEPLPETPDKLKGPPAKVSGKVSYFSASLGGREVLFAMDSSRPPKLYVDTNANDDLSDEEPVKRARAGRGRGWFAAGMNRFGPVSFAVPATEPEQVVRFSAIAYGPDFLLLHPAGFFSGEVQLHGKSYRVALVDGNFDGRYDSFFAPSTGPRELECDILAIDLDRDRQFNLDMFESREILPLPKMLQVEEQYYGIRVAPSGSTLSLEKANPEFGTLDVGCADSELKLYSESGLHSLSGSEGKWQLPTGRYMAFMVKLARADSKRARWELMAYGETGKLQDFEIRKGETLSLKVGPPLVARVDAEAEKRKRVVSIGLELVGEAGEKYAPGAERNGKTVPAPKFKIVDEAGKVLTSASFEYG